MLIPTSYLAIACLILSALGALCSLVKRRRYDALACISVALSAASLLSPAIAATQLFAMGFMLALVAAFNKEQPNIDQQFGKFSQHYAPLVAIIGVGLVLYRIGADSGPIFLWEHENIHGLSLLSLSDEPLSKRLLKYLIWHDAPLAAGHQSALFGLPALAICKNVVSALWSIRIVSAVAFLASMALIFVFVRRAYGRTCAAIAASLLIFNEVVLSYGRYASASAASLCALLVALVLCARLVRRAELPCALLAAAALYAATLGYAAARVAVVAIAATVLIGLLLNSSQRLSRRMAAAGVFAGVLAGIVAWQTSMGSLSALFQARSEQFFYMVTQGGFPLELQQTEVGPLLSNRNPSTVERARLAWALVRVVTGRQFARGIAHWSAASDDATVDGPFVDRPLGMPLIGCLSLPFLALGFFSSLRVRPFWASFAMLGWFGLNTAALLLTNRIDVHRQFFLIVPLVVWTALGVTEWLCAMRRSSKTLGVTALVAIALLPCAFAPRWLEAIQHSTDEAPQMRSIHDLLNQEPGTLFVVADLPPSQESRIRIGLMERLRSTGRKGQVGDSGYRNGLADGNFTNQQQSFENLDKALLAGESVVLIPAERYSQLAAALTSRGANLSRLSGEQISVVMLKKAILPNS